MNNLNNRIETITPSLCSLKVCHLSYLLQEQCVGEQSDPRSGFRQFRYGNGDTLNRYRLEPEKDIFDKRGPEIEERNSVKVP